MPIAAAESVVTQHGEAVGMLGHDQAAVGRLEEPAPLAELPIQRVRIGSDPWIFSASAIDTSSSVFPIASASIADIIAGKMTSVTLRSRRPSWTAPDGPRSGPTGYSLPSHVMTGVLIARRQRPRLRGHGARSACRRRWRRRVPRSARRLETAAP